MMTFSLVFFFNATATTEIYTLSLHDALPISLAVDGAQGAYHDFAGRKTGQRRQDRKSTRLNSSHPSISYAVFCLKKKNASSNVPIVPTKHREQENGHVC